MDSWVRSFIGGLMLAAFAVGAIWLFNIYEGILYPYLHAYLGVEDVTFVGLIILVFLVGFAMTSKRQSDEFEEYIGRPNRIFSGPNNRVRPSHATSEVEELELVQDAYINYLQDRIKKLDENQAVVLKIKLHPPAKLDFHFFGRAVMPLQRDVILYYLEHLKSFPNFKYVIFTDWYSRFLFFCKAEDLRKEITPIEGTHLLDLMNGNRVEELSEDPLFNQHALTNHATNLKALRYMARHDISEVMITSHTWGRQTVGVVEVNKLLAQMLAPKKDLHKKPDKKKKRPSAQPMYDDNRADPVLISDDDVSEAPDIVTVDKRREPRFDHSFDDHDD